MNAPFSGLAVLTTESSDDSDNKGWTNPRLTVAGKLVDVRSIFVSREHSWRHSVRCDRFGSSSRPGSQPLRIPVTMQKQVTQSVERSRRSSRSKGVKQTTRHGVEGIALGKKTDNLLCTEVGR